MVTLHTLPPAADPVPPADLDPDVLADRLQAGARGDVGTEAAVALIVNHDQWTRRREFLESCTFTAADRQGDLPFVWIDWAKAAAHARSVECSPSARAVVLLGAELAGDAPLEAVRDLFVDLDAHAARLAVQAICRLIDLDGRRNLTWCEDCAAALPARAHTEHTHSPGPAVTDKLKEVA